VVREVNGSVSSEGAEGPIVSKTTEYKESNEVYKRVAEDVRSLSDTSAYEMRGQSLQ
jgi:hypothetical protein